MTDTRAQHWEEVYARRADDAVSWHQDRPQPSFDMIAAELAPGDPVIDVGGGASRLVDALLAAGLGPVTVLDISQTALATARARLGARADAVSWLAADVTAWQPGQAYELWHDRAVFHFLTEPGDRAAYVAALAAALRPDGRAIIASFDATGPEMCSGLPVVRYTPEALAAEIDRHAPGVFALRDSRRHAHRTPKGATQEFQFSLFDRIGGARGG